MNITVFYRNQNPKTSLRTNCCEERGIGKKEEVRMQERKENSKQSLTLRNGVSMPLLGFGVLQMKDPEECERCVREAFESGYRMFDTAASYGNEREVGNALKKIVEEGKARREDLFVITKLWIDGASEVPPMVNQVELHPFYHQDDALRIMKELGVQPQAWAPLCEGLKNIFSNKILEKTGKKYGKTAAQTALRWNIDRGVSVVTRSSVPEHMRENQDIWDFSLTETELSAIDQLDLGYSEILDYGNPCIARRRERLEALQQDCAVPLHILAMDLTEEDAADRLEQELKAEKPEIGILVNGAGFGKIGSWQDVARRESSAMIRLNCQAAVEVTLVCIPYLKKKSRILQICSTAAFQPFPELNVYAATKAFLYRYSRALRWELRGKRICVTAVCPYWVRDTEFISVAKDTDRKKVIRHFPLASKASRVVSWALADSKLGLAVSTPGPVCMVHRLTAKFLPSDIMMAIWELIRRL